MHQKLFDHNPEISALMRGRHNYFLQRLSIVSQEYALLQIAKLHDPALQQGRTNLTSDYILEFGGWDTATTSQLHDLREKLNQLGREILRPARHRILSHNDLESILSGAVLGQFPEKHVDEYFAQLQQFADIAHDRFVGGPFPFDDLALADVEVLLDALRSESAPHGERT